MAVRGRPDAGSPHPNRASSVIEDQERPLASTWVEVSRTSDRRRGQELALVLQAIGIAHGVAANESGFLVLVPSADAARAAEQIARYERENRGWPPREEPFAPLSNGIQAAIVYAGLVALFFLFEARDAFGVDWLAAGRAQAGAIRSGEWWRCLTALSLHGDLTHLAGNVVFGSAFAIILAQNVGSGLAWLGFLAAGGAGNALNAWIQPESHTSIGASTGLFGALGIQIAYEWMRRREFRTGALRRWTPIVMGIGLLGFLGTGGGGFDATGSPKERQEALERILERVDVLAHLTGFAAGIVLGLALGASRRLRPGPRMQGVLAWSAPLVLACAWALALRAR